MTIRQQINVLKARGHKVKFFSRKDGGVIITNIDGVSYRGASGNAVARQLTGETLSSARSEQLSDINKYIEKARKKGERIKSPQERKLEKFPEDLEKELSRVQRKWYRKFSKGAKDNLSRGVITRKRIRRLLQEEGKEKVASVLQEYERYASGYANLLNIDTFISELEKTFIALGRSDLLDLAEELKSYAIDITEDMLKDLIAWHYEVLKGSWPVENLEANIRNLIDTKLKRNRERRLAKERG